MNKNEKLISPRHRKVISGTGNETCLKKSRKVINENIEEIYESI
jgi:hypothetical protein